MHHMTSPSTLYKLCLNKKWFDLLDGDGSGEISVEDLQDPLLSMGLLESREEISRLIAAFDHDGSGKWKRMGAN